MSKTPSDNLSPQLAAWLFDPMTAERLRLADQHQQKLLNEAVNLCYANTDEALMRLRKVLALRTAVELLKSPEL